MIEYHIFSIILQCFNRNLVLDPWERSSKENNAQMVNEVCKKVGNKCLPPRYIIDEEGMDVHPHPSTVKARSHDPPSYSSGQKEEYFHK